MPEKLFYELDEEKRARIISAALREFSRFSYNESSTNRIVRNAGIGKGSLFKYFQDKKALYFYILDSVMAEFTGTLEGEIINLPEDLFERIVKYAALEFDWYVGNPEKYELIKKAFVKSGTEVFRETEKRYSLKGEEIYRRIFEDVKAGRLKWEKEKLLHILKWFLKGFNEQFIEEMQPQDGIGAVKDAYLRRLIQYIEILKEGLQ